MFVGFRWAIVLGLALVSAGGCCAAEVTSRTNIIFIMADDLGAEALACYGNDKLKTPNLDRLATQGARFTHAYSTPLCTPTRVQVMTGKYNHRNYIGFGLMDKNEKTFAHYLKQAGYTTGIAGKWQLLGNKKQRELAGGKSGARPEDAGFDDYCLWQVDELGSRYKDPTITTPAGTKMHKGAYGPDMFTSFSLGFVNANKGRPFFLYYPMVLTHDPFQPTPDSPDFAASDAWKTKDSAYFGSMVEYMDKQVGKLVDEVERLGLAEQTLIIFTGDNGTGRKVISTVKGKEIEGGKGLTTRFGTNVPLIASWKGVIKGGRVNENLVDFTDFLPTFLEVAGTPLPGSGGLEGLSFCKQLLGEDTKVRDWVFCYYEPQWKKADLKKIWAQTKTWKLYSDGRFFNIDSDPSELSPLDEAGLAAEATAVRAKLSKVIEEKMAGSQ